MINALPLNHAHPKNSFSTNQQQYRVTLPRGGKSVTMQKKTHKRQINLKKTNISVTTKALPKRSKIKKTWSYSLKNKMLLSTVFNSTTR